MKNKRRKKCFGLIQFYNSKNVWVFIYLFIVPHGTKNIPLWHIGAAEGKKKNKKIEGLCLGAGKIKNF